MLVLLMNTSCQEIFNPEEKLAEYNSEKIDKEKILLWKRFNKQYNDKWRVSWNKKTGTPRKISGYRIEYDRAITERYLEQITSGFINQHKRLLEIDRDQLVLSKIKIDEIDSNRSGNSYVYYNQLYNGIPVFNSSVAFVFHGKELTYISSEFFPGIRMRTTPRLSKKDIYKIAVESCSLNDRIRPEKTRLIIYPSSGNNKMLYHLAYEVDMPEMKVPEKILDISNRTAKSDKLIPVKWKLFIDANTGYILNRVNMLVYNDLSGTVSAMIYPDSADQAQVSAVMEGIQVYAYSDLSGSNKKTAVTDNNGFYSFSGLTYTPAYIESNLRGSHIRVFNDESAEAYYLNFNVTGNTLKWNWGGHDQSPNQVESNAYYHTNFIRNWFRRGAPFNVTPVSPNGPGEDWVEVHVRCEGLSYPALAFPLAGKIKFSVVYDSDGNQTSDAALKADVIYHEYTHLVISQIYEELLLPGLNDYYDAINEGFAKYFGLSILDDPNPAFDEPNLRYPDDFNNNQYNNLKIIAGAVWDIRKVLGAEYTDNLTFRTLKRRPLNFSEFLGHMIEEDDNPLYSADPAANNDVTDGTPNINLICDSSYYNHGIYHSYCSGFTSSPIAVITSPSPDEKRITVHDNSVSEIEIFGTVTGSINEDLQQYTIEYLSEQDMDTWYSDNISLQNNGQSSIVDGLLGVWNISSVQDGFYLVKLTAAYNSGDTIEAFTNVYIERDLMAGWTGEIDHNLLYPPIAAEIDPGYPGREIIARDDFGNISAYHLDGTPVQGWPKTVNSFPWISPVSADLDADCIPEIIAAGGDKIHVFNSRFINSDESAEDESQWPVTLDNEIGDFYSIAVADIDWDKYPEVIMAVADGTVYAWNHDGSNVDGWPINAGAGIHTDVAVGDVVKHLWRIPETAANTRYSWNLGELIEDGSIVNIGHGTNIDIGNSYYDRINRNFTDLEFAEAVIQDQEIIELMIPMDGLEIVICNDEGDLKVFNSGGRLIRGWPKNINSPIASPALADIDNDRDLEIIIGSLNNAGEYFNGEIYGYHHNGAPIPGWPVTLASDFFNNTSIVIANIDKTGPPEIFMNGYEMVHIRNYDGSVYPNSPYDANDFNTSSGRNLLTKALLVADINLDGQNDIIKTNSGIEFGRDNNEYEEYGRVTLDKIFAIDQNGMVLPNWPQYIPGSPLAPLIDDLDYDGHPELMVGENRKGIYIWDFPGSGTEIPVGEWTNFREDQWRRGYYSDLPDLAIKSYEMEWTGSNKEISLVVVNKGLGDAGAFSVSISVGYGAPFNPALEGLKMDVSSLASGESIVLTHNFNNYGLPPSSESNFLGLLEQIKFQIDYFLDDIREDNEGNNMLVISDFE